MPPAARVTDMHTCPMVNPGPVPHVGGPILPPGAPTVLINFLPAAKISSMATCVGPPDTIIKGSTGVFIDYLPAARLGDQTTHGGVIVMGSPNVNIGEIGSPSPGAAGVGGVAGGLVAALGIKAGKTPAYASGAPAKRKPITQAQANAEFKKMAAAANRITFDYPQDCCYSRAQEMSRMLKADGVDSGKVWNYANPGPPKGSSPAGPALTVNTPNTPTGDVAWRYHVAPVVDVKGDDGVVRTEVIDPSMFNYPVTVDEWKAAQHAPNSITQYDDHFDPNTSPYYRGIDGTTPEYDPDYSKAKDQMQIHQHDRDAQDPGFVKELAKRRQARVLENSK